jgi:hypothetical protein
VEEYCSREGNHPRIGAGSLCLASIPTARYFAALFSLCEIESDTPGPAKPSECFWRCCRLRLMCTRLAMLGPVEGEPKAGNFAFGLSATANQEDFGLAEFCIHDSGIYSSSGISQTKRLK